METYIRHRLSVGGSLTEVFHRRAYKTIHGATKGIPRLINLVAERSLIAGYITSKPVVGKKEVKAAMEDLKVA